MKTNITFKFAVLAFMFTLITTNISAQWTPVNNGLPELKTRGVVNLLDTLFTAVNGHGIYYSVNNGDNWVAWKNNSKLKTNQITKLEAATNIFNMGGDSNESLFYAYGQSMLDVYQSGTGGVSGVSNFYNFNALEGITTSWRTEENWKDTGSEIEFLSNENGVYYTQDDSQTWTSCTGLTGDALLVNGLYYHDQGNSSDGIYALTNDGVYRALNETTSFVAFRNGIAAGVKVYEQHFLTCASNGVYMYNDDSDMYIPLISGGDFRTSILDFATFEAFAFGNGVAKRINLMTQATEDVSQQNITGGVIISATLVGDYIFVCTENGGVFRMSNNPLSLDDQKYIEGFSMYPNPVKDIVNISAKESIIGISVYNLMGQQLFNKDANDSQVAIDLTGLAEGAYFVKVQTQKATQVVKFIKQ